MKYVFFTIPELMILRVSDNPDDINNIKWDGQLEYIEAPEFDPQTQYIKVQKDESDNFIVVVYNLDKTPVTT